MSIFPVKPDAEKKKAATQRRGNVYFFSSFPSFSESSSGGQGSAAKKKLFPPFCGEVTSPGVILSREKGREKKSRESFFFLFLLFTWERQNTPPLPFSPTAASLFDGSFFFSFDEMFFRKICCRRKISILFFHLFYNFCESIKKLKYASRKATFLGFAQFLA